MLQPILFWVMGLSIVFRLVIPWDDQIWIRKFHQERLALNNFLCIDVMYGHIDAGDASRTCWTKAQPCVQRRSTSTTFAADTLALCFPRRRREVFFLFPSSTSPMQSHTHGKKEEDKVSERIMKTTSFRTCLLSLRKNTTLLMKT